MAVVKIQFLTAERVRIARQLVLVKASLPGSNTGDEELAAASRAYLDHVDQLAALVTDHRHVVTRAMLAGVARGLEALQRLLRVQADGHLDKETYLRTIADLELDVEAKLACFDETKSWIGRFLDLERATERLVHVRAVNVTESAARDLEVWYNSVAGEALGNEASRFPTIGIPTELSLAAGRYLIWFQSFDGRIISQKLKIQVRAAQNPMYVDLPVIERGPR